MVYKPTHITGGGVMYIYIYISIKQLYNLYIIYIYTHVKAPNIFTPWASSSPKDAQLNQAGSMGEIVKSGIVNSNGYAMDVFLPPMDVIIGVLIHILGNIYIYAFWLVVWNMNGLFFHILGISYSQLTKSYFSEGLKPPTSIVLIHSHVHI